MSWKKLRTNRTGQYLITGQLLLGGAAVFLVILMPFFTPTVSHADDIEVTPILGYTFGGGLENSISGNDLDMAEGESFGVILGLRDKSRTGAMYEFLYSRQSTSLKGDGTAFSDDPRFDIDINYFHLGGIYGKEGEALNPYVSGGLGVTHMSPERGDSETRFSFSLGGGLMIPLSARVGLRLEGRGFGTFFNDRSSIFCVNNSCVVRIRGDLMWQFTAFTGVVFNF